MVEGQGRFIPTHVGNTLVSANPAASDFGSSPRTWGTLGAVQRAEVVQRFIPTHVGNTLKPPASKVCAPVHPHARGEHYITAPVISSLTGSSPRTWGTHRSPISGRQVTRFIPTHVGNTG